MRVMKWSMIALAVAAGTSQMALASDQDDSKGFIEGSTLNLKSRLMYMNRDYRHGAEGARGNGYAEESGLGEVLMYESGFTQGTVGVGVDAFGLANLRIDGGKGRVGTGLSGVDSDGSPETFQSQGGAAVKFRVSNSVLKVGDQFVASPVFATDDSRLLPESASGALLTIKEIKDLEVNFGRFTALSTQTGTARDSGELTKATFGGATYHFTENLLGTFAASDVEDYFKKQYINANYTLPISDGQSLNFDLNAYRTKSQGEELYGDIDNKIWSLAAAYALGAHKFTLAYQRSTGDGGYLYGIDGGGTIFLANSIQVSDFVGEGEKSWQARYDLDMSAYGVPGLSFMTRYVTGDNITTGSGVEGKEHEWNLEAKYVLQEGPAKDLSFRVRHAIYRANDAYTAIYARDMNDTRLIIEYPLSIL